MLKTYDHVVSWMDRNLSKQVKPGLERVEYLLSKWNNPESKLKVIHIAGTNGKGSTLQLLKNLLLSHGKTVGAFTSPFFHKWNEQIECSRTLISDIEIVDRLNQVIPIIKDMEKLPIGIPSEFEVITVVALHYFASENMDYVLMEAGLGGRLDSTNVVAPIHTIITSIGLDHTNILGNTYKEIAFEKAGIMKKNIPLVTAVEQEEALNVIYENSKKLNTPIFQLGRDFHISIDGRLFTFHNQTNRLEHLELQMLGRHQMRNAALALQSFFLIADKEKIAVKESEIKESLFATSWKGRFEIVNKNPVVIMDGAHNSEGTATLIHTLDEMFPNKRKHIIFSVMKDKPIQKMIQQIDHGFDTVWFTSFPNSRVESASVLYQLSSHPDKHVKGKWQEVYSSLIEYLDYGNDVIVFSGSLYFISHVLETYAQKCEK